MPKMKFKEKKEKKKKSKSDLEVSERKVATKHASAKSVSKVNVVFLTYCANTVLNPSSMTNREKRLSAKTKR